MTRIFTDMTGMTKKLIITRAAIVLLAVMTAFSMLTCAPARAAENADTAETGTVSEQTEQPAQTDGTAGTTAGSEETDGEETGEAAGTTGETEGSEEAVEEPAAEDEEAGETKADKELSAPDPVDNVTAKAIARGKIKIKWSKVKNADGYYIYRASSKGGKYKKIKKIRSGKKTSYVHTFKKPRKNKRYYFKVYAYKVVKGDTLVSGSTDKDPAKNTISYKKKYKMRATAYSGGGLCANGKKCKVGRVAVDPDVIPLGTWLYVKGYGFCQACDTGGAIQGKRIDLYFNSESKCNRYGVQTTTVYVLRK